MAIVDKAGACVALAGILAFGGVAHALSAADKCKAAKNKIAGKYAFCRQKAYAQAITTGAPFDSSKCDTKFLDKWTSAEINGGGMCPTNGDSPTILMRETGGADDVAACLNGTCPATCGDGMIGGSEDCDQGNLNGKTCVTQGFASGTLACGAGCHFDTSGCSATRLVDNGDGTITDIQTHLMWEKDTEADLSDGFEWCRSFDNCSPFGGYDQDGFENFFVGIANVGHGDFYNGLNLGCSSSDGTTITGGFAGHCDWRVPTVAELKTILDLTAPGCGSGQPCINAAFGFTDAGYYWSSTTYSVDTSYAWAVSFFNGAVSPGPKNLV